MALDFPSSPINGQIYGNYYYNSTLGAWNSFASANNLIPSILNNLSVSTTGSALTPFVVRGVSGQSVNLQEWQDQSNVVLASMSQTGQFSASSVSATSNGAGQNFRVGDDVWLGDINLANTMSIRGVSNAANGYIVFGSGDNTALGRSGTGALTYGGNTVWHAGNDGATSGLDADLLDGQHGSVYSPAGMVSQFAGSMAPTGWLICDGTAISRTTYATLFTAIGTAYGVGDNSTTFNLPNLQGRVPAGKAASGTFATLAATGGAETVALAEANVPSHTHTFSGTTSTDGNHSHSPSGSNVDGFVAHMTALDGSQAAGIPTTINGYIVSTRNTNTTGAHSHTYSGTTSTGSGSGTAHNNLQPYIVMNYIIKT